MTPAELIRLPSRLAWAAAAVILLAIVLIVLGRCSRSDEVRQARSDARVAEATGEALDRVASQTPEIRREQEERQNAVDKIEGADQRLPDGFGVELERVRRGGR